MCIKRTHLFTLAFSGVISLDNSMFNTINCSDGVLYRTDASSSQVSNIDDMIMLQGLNNLFLVSRSNPGLCIVELREQNILIFNYVLFI